LFPQGIIAPSFSIAQNIQEEKEKKDALENRIYISADVQREKKCDFFMHFFPAPLERCVIYWAVNEVFLNI